ncbi:TerB family tellurite resistance protein [Waterburya agarophytonicola K14]|uniref:TerB family tellurite resistance protein n=1 Tax=Waterburya agarophytonicola KI4 TaxID=2874699 RepID=A0A964BPZ0_9CYAN|nr:TerB family tellurite resistance protein [Waterburya agarophytonicola]MCC0176192.1 TerB family tellurite resistance protein [Waterburya agarophytonicola KI4]
MSQLAKSNDRDLFKILVAVAWIDGEIQSQEREFLTKIAAEHNLELPEDLLTTRQLASTDRCYDLLREYLGSDPTTEDYENLLSAVSTLIYCDNDIATAEASLLTKMQNLDPRDRGNNSAFNKLIAKIQKLYQKGIDSV